MGNTSSSLHCTDGSCSDSLEGVVAFCSLKQQMKQNSTEGLHHPGTDRRNRIDYMKLSNYYWNHCQIRGKTLKGDVFVGTGYIWNHPTYGLYILTCAHNVIAVDNLKKKKQFYPDLYAYQCRQGEDAYEKKLQILSTVPHPKYNGDGACGYDIAVCIYKELNGKNFMTDRYSIVEKKLESYQFQIDTSQLKEYDFDEKTKIGICGYPGQSDKVGYIYEHVGNFKEILKTDLGGWMITYDVDTTPGNSGSPVVIGDINGPIWKTMNDNAKKKFKDYKWACVGIHTCSSEGGYNMGTLITKEINIWIEKQLAIMHHQNEN